MFKKLKIKIVDVCSGGVSIVITEQSHRGNSFWDYSDRCVKAGNPVGLYSIAAPDCPNKLALFVRGGHKEHDDNRLTLYNDMVDDVFDMILYYNQHYNKNKLELADVVENLHLLEGRNV